MLKALFATLAPWPLKLARGARESVSWVFADTRRVLAALLALAVAYGYHERVGRLTALAEADECRSAFDIAVADANAAAAQAETHNRSVNDAVQISYDAGRIEGHKQLSAWVATRRLQHAAENPSSPATKSDVAAVPANPATKTGVALITPPVGPQQVLVDEAELGKCDALYTYARGAYEWAQGLANPSGSAAPASRPTP